MPVDWIRDHEASRQIIELCSEISSLHRQVRALEFQLDRKLDRYDPAFRKLDRAVFNLRMWCAYLTAFVAAGVVVIAVIASKLP
ncbi:MAG: hypothetical protein JST73_10825 [Actinobacteria bacterium]|nr:hypothetical protein [Actinomycetota bacterium]